MNDRQLSFDMRQRDVGVAYVRTSTRQQLLGIDAQRGKIREWAARHDVEIVSWHEEVGVSGAKPIARRPALAAALRDIRSHRATCLVVSERDRLARDVSIIADIERALETMNATIGCANGSDASLSAAEIDAFAERERVLISHRTKDALRIKRQRQELRAGCVPFGKRLASDGKRLIDDEDEIRTLARIHELRASGLSLRRIVQRLDAEGHRPRGSRWHLTSVVKFLMGNERFAP